MTFNERVSRKVYLVKIENKNPWRLNMHLWELIKT